MIKRIIGAMLLFDLLVAVAISLVYVANGQDIQPVKIGTEFMSFVRSSSLEMNSMKIAIPDIPKIDFKFDMLSNPNGDWWTIIANALLGFINGFFGFLNGIVALLNMLINVLNVIISLIQLLFVILKNLMTMKENTEVYEGGSWLIV